MRKGPPPLSLILTVAHPLGTNLSLPQPSAAIKSKAVAIIFALEVLSTRQIYTNSAGYEKSRQNFNNSISFLLYLWCFTLPLVLYSTLRLYTDTGSLYILQILNAVKFNSLLI